MQSDSATSSYWLKHVQRELNFEDAFTNSYVDTLVIGAGITGCSIAYHLSKMGTSCGVCDSRSLCGGATGRNGGLLWGGLNESFATKVNKHGRENAKSIFKFEAETVRVVKEFIKDHNIDCDVVHGGAVNVFLEQDDFDEEVQGLRALQREGLATDCVIWSKEECARNVGSDHFLGGIYDPKPVQVYAAKLTEGIAREARRLGARFQTNCRVSKIEKASAKVDGRAWTVTTARGVVHCRHLVHATNAYTPHLVPELREFITPVRGQAIATVPTAPLWKYCLLTNYGFEYWSQRTDGRVVLGGFREVVNGKEENCSDDSVVNPDVSKPLRAFLSTRFDALRNVDVEMEWSGIMGFSKDRSPIVGPITSGGGVQWVCAGFTGHGMPQCFLAGKAVAEMIHGRRPEVFCEVFLPASRGIPSPQASPSCRM